MPELITPTLQLHQSFLELWDEIAAHGEDASSWLNWGQTESREQLDDPAVFAGCIAGQVALATMPDEKLPTGSVRSTTLWWTEQGQILGRVSIRHALTEHLFEIGGHIGYIIRPSARLQGQAMQLLSATLPVAAELGINPALVTCDVDNVGSRKVIEANGGVLDDIRHGKRRYWVPTR